MTWLLKVYILTPSRSPWQSPVVSVKKEVAKFIVCVDQRTWNNHFNVCASPCSLYWIYWIEHEDATTSLVLIWKGTISKFLWLRQPRIFREFAQVPEVSSTLACLLDGARRLQFFNKLWNVAFFNLLPKNIRIFLDDIIITSRTFDEHIEKFQLVPQRLAEYNFTVNPTKCNFPAASQRVLEFSWAKTVYSKI